MCDSLLFTRITLDIEKTRITASQESIVGQTGSDGARWGGGKGGGGGGGGLTAKPRCRRMSAGPLLLLLFTVTQQNSLVVPLE